MDNPGLLIALIAGGGGTAWLIHRNRMRTTYITKIGTLLQDDDGRVVEGQKVPMAQTSVNLAEVLLRKNAGEIQMQAALLAARNYTSTAQWLTNFANSL